jgi:hypothetical protein
VHRQVAGVDFMGRILVGGLLMIAMACAPKPSPFVEEDGGTIDTPLDGGFTGDAGLFEIHGRDAGAFIDAQMPWSWASVEAVLTTPPSSGEVSGRWLPVTPSAVDRAWAGGVLLFDGRVVAVPFNEASVLVIQPSNDTFERWPVAGGGVPEGWQGGVLLPDGKVIAIPRNANRFLRIDPVARTAEPFGDDLSDLGNVDKFRGGVLGLNGQVYAAPSNSKFIARLDPATGVVTRIPIPPTMPRGASQGAVVFPTGDIVMFPAYDLPGLLVIPSQAGREDEVWLLPRPRLDGEPAFNAGGVVTGYETAVSPPHQNAMPMRYEAGRLSWMAPLPGISPQSANAWFYGAWSTNGHFYAPPFGQRDAIGFSLERDAVLRAFDPNASVFRGVFGVVALPDGRIIGIPHARSSWLELSPAGRRTMPSEAFTSPWLNKL